MNVQKYKVIYCYCIKCYLYTKKYLKYEIFVKSWTGGLFLKLGLQISSLIWQQVHSGQPQHIVIGDWRCFKAEESGL